MKIISDGRRNLSQYRDSWLVQEVDPAGEVLLELPGSMHSSHGVHSTLEIFDTALREIRTV